MRRIFLLLVLAACHHQSDLPKLFPLPDAKLVNESGQPLQLASLKGKVVVYDFIFTNCAGTCPMMTAAMRRVTAKVDKDAPVRFVSISVDPKRDTPPVLAAYAQRVRNDPRWTFLTGDWPTIKHLSVDGFKLATDDQLLHSAKFAVADKNGVVREYVSSLEDDAVEHVARTVEDLARE
ncbi:MAG TPA: SCO family protein [Thermoanaerobaculia bacterium]|jgi:protein SCO1/2